VNDKQNIQKGRSNLVYKTMLLLFFFVELTAYSQPHNSLLFYNVENLFDTFDDSLTNDNEFTPWGEKHWSHKRFNQKLRHIFQTIVASDKGNMPDFIGLCEVENYFCLKQLVDSTPLWKADYKIVHFNSPDKRGIDVALLYKSSTVSVINAKPVRIQFENPDVKSRDVLYVHANLNENDYHLFVNHWPSKRGGESRSEKKRIQVALALRQTVDSILSTDSMAKIIICGDFNESPKSEAVKDYLKAGRIGAGNELYNLALESKQIGTHKYRGRWEFLDQIIVSDAFFRAFPSCGFSVTEISFLLVQDPSWTGNKPYRTYQGPMYIGGYSDHLPVLLKW